MADSDKSQKRVKQIRRQLARKVQSSEDRTELLVENIRRFLERNLRTILDDLRGESVTAKQAAKALGGLESAMIEAGLGEQLQRLREPFTKEWDAVTEEFESTTGKKALLGQFVRQNLESLRDDRIRLAGKMIEKHLGDVQGVVLDEVLSGRRVNPEKVIENAGDAVYRNIRTEIQTSVMAFNRLGHIAKAEKAGITQFLYVGPDDERTRPFCSDHVDRVYSLEEIRAMDNGQGLPVEVYGGGYNCRHHWRPVSDSLAEEFMASRNAETNPS